MPRVPEYVREWRAYQRDLARADRTRARALAAMRRARADGETFEGIGAALGFSKQRARHLLSEPDE